MRLKVLGSGGMFTIRNYHSNFLIMTDEEHNLLIDCGSDIKHSLKDSGFTYKDIDAIYISHLHGDHAGGCEYIGYLKYFDPSQSKPDLFISELLVDDLWNMLRPSMATYQGKSLKLSDYFNINIIKGNGFFCYDSVRYSLVQTFHVMDCYKIIPSFGLSFNYGENNILFTSDTQLNDMIKQIYSSHNIIIQEVETSPYPSGVHCHIGSLSLLDQGTRDKMNLYHYGDNVLDGNLDDYFQGFGNYFQKGEEYCFEISRVEKLKKVLDSRL